MHTLTPTRCGLRHTGLAALAAEALCALQRAAADAAQRWHRRSQARATERALREISPYLLRDLGLDASEIASIAHAVSAGDDSRLRRTQGWRLDLARH